MEASPGWRKLQRRIFENHVVPVIGHLKLSQVGPTNISKVFSTMHDRGLDPQSRMHAFNLLRKMFNDAIVSFKYLSESPIIVQRHRPVIPEKESRHLKVPQVRRLLEHVRGKLYELAIWLGVMVGLRIGEIQALRWSDFDEEAGILHVRRTYVRLEKIIKDFPKGGRHHSHRVPQELWELLAIARKTATSELVVVPNGWRMLYYSHYRKTLAKYSAEAEVAYVATHGFRHSSSGVYMAHGATPEDMQSLFSHGESRTTRRYLHVPDKRVDRVASVIRLFPEKCSTNVPRSDFSELEILKEVNQVIEI